MMGGFNHISQPIFPPLLMFVLIIVIAYTGTYTDK